MTSEEINRIAEIVRASDVPDFLNRWLGMTPELFDAYHAALARTRARWAQPTITWKDIDVRTGPKEATLRLQREHSNDRPEGSPADTTGTTTTPPEETTMSTSATKKPKAKATKAKKKPSTERRAAPKKKAARNSARASTGVREGSKLETIVGMLRRKEGCTAKDVMEACDWPSVSMPQQARAAGIKLKTEKDGRITRYFAAD